MSTENQAGPLHDKATRGIPLTPAEERLLEAWYDKQDRDERAMLEHPQPYVDIATLQANIDKGTLQLQAVTARIQRLTAENDMLRQYRSIFMNSRRPF